MKSIRCSIAATLLATIAFANPTHAQAPTPVAAPAEAPRARAPQAPPVVSPEIGSDGQVTFRIRAPKAEVVRLSGGDIPGVGQGTALTRNAEGIWEITLGPIQPGSYRYHFNVDDVAVVDPRNPATSESNANTWSLVTIPGADFMDTRNVPHGAVSAVTYYSTALQRFRRMHVYTPPGYESGQGQFPVFYLLHGASDSDHSWSSVGRAGFILDNLIAGEKAKPMIVVMPAGHTGPFRFGGPRFGADEFVQDFLTDIMPHIETNYRVLPGRQNRAMAGLSMGGGHTLHIGIPNLEKFAYLGVFSSGVFGITGGGPGGSSQGPSFEEQHNAVLTNAKLKQDLKLFWFATGKDDFLLETSRATVAMLKKHEFDVDYQETEGAHTWIVWREYLNEFVPQLF
jgi:enterochelin esterase-like enzyme